MLDTNDDKLFYWLNGKPRQSAVPWEILFDRNWFRIIIAPIQPIMEFAQAIGFSRERMLDKIDKRTNWYVKRRNRHCDASRMRYVYATPLWICYGMYALTWVSLVHSQQSKNLRTASIRSPILTHEPMYFLHHSSLLYVYMSYGQESILSGWKPSYSIV